MGRPTPTRRAKDCCRLNIFVSSFVPLGRLCRRRRRRRWRILHAAQNRFCFAFSRKAKDKIAENVRDAYKIEEEEGKCRK